MELEFDKEIDAILRRSGENRGVLVGDDPREKPTPHLDADIVAAFVENALPDKAKRLYMEHFADCGGCRKLLTQSILMDQTAAPSAADAAEIVPASAAVPWYIKLFRTPNLALAMGALVLTFSGVLGYLVLQRRDSQNATVSQVADQQRPSDPYSIDGAAANTANTSANANTAANTASAQINTPPPGIANSGAGPSITLDGVASDNNFSVGAPEGAKPVERPADPVTSAPAPPPPPPARVGEEVREEPSNLRGVTLDMSKESKDEDAELAKRKVIGDDRARRDMPASPAKSGPSRAAGPVQMQSNQVNTQTFEMTVSRKVGGRTFENKGGAWYDRKYAGQATINVRRGTDEFTRLDSGLRKIANELGGVVVVVWKNKAYRIQ
jgi:hypothetical protein